MMQSLFFSNVMALLLCLLAGALSASLGNQAYTEAVPRRDFTLQNMSRTTDEVFAAQSRAKRSDCPCQRTDGVYGRIAGTEFVDIQHNPCEVEQITDIWVRHGTLVDAIQVRYFTSKDGFVKAPLRGGNGGGLTHIPIPFGARIIGMTGGIGDLPQYGQLISQLRILVLNPLGQIKIYGPFGTDLYSFPGSFAVYGNIKSIFGSYQQYLNGLGVYYVPLGGSCPGACGHV